MNRFLKVLFVALIVKPVVLIILGLNVVNRQKLPQSGPAIIAANHNSHLDTMVLFSLYPLSEVHKLRPVAAADYFLRNPLMAWFSMNVIGIIPISRSGTVNKEELFKGCHNALDQGDILILFPEGTRGEPEHMSKLKKGIYHLTKDREDTPVIPIMTHGLGRALPKGEALLVPFNCDVVVGDPLPATSTCDQMLELLSDAYSYLLQKCLTYRMNGTNE
jgi:1-acyl-sn-glycerol-3-phosphate acyltransferase